jgi:heme A synthase
MPETTSAPTRTASGLRTLGAFMLLALLAQLLLGMANTFWLSVPETGSGWADAAPAGLLMGHLTLGVALAVLAIWIAVLAWRRHERPWLIASATGLVAIVIAIGAGFGFMSEVSDDTASYLMAVGTAVAIGGYAYGLYRLPSDGVGTQA